VDPQAIVRAAERVIGELEAGGHRTCLAHAGVSTAYHSDEDSTGRWITRFLEGYFTPSDAGTADASVYSTGDAALFAALQGLATRQSGLGKNEYAEIPFPGPVAVVHTRATKVTPEEDVYLLLLKEERTIVLATSGNLEVRREEGMQTVRALAKWLLLERGWIPMHSACVARDGRAICIAGEKSSGKTSTLLNLLARDGCDLLAIDKFLVRGSGSDLEVCGLPGKAGIRVGSAIVHPQVLAWLSGTAESFFPHLSAADVRQIAATNTPEQLRQRTEKIHLLPTELAGLFGAGITPAAPLEILLSPVFDLGLHAPRLVPVEPEQAIRTLTACYAGLLSKGEGFLLNFFDLDDALLRERLATLLPTRAPGVEAYELHQNHRTNEEAAALVAAALTSAA
jgi:hypothetical protein